MNNLIIDAANEKIFFTIIADNKSYTSEFSNNRENFDKLAILVVKFLENHHLSIKNLSFDEDLSFNEFKNMLMIYSKRAKYPDLKN